MNNIRRYSIIEDFKQSGINLTKAKTIQKLIVTVEQDTDDIKPGYARYHVELICSFIDENGQQMDTYAPISREFGKYLTTYEMIEYENKWLLEHFRIFNLSDGGMLKLARYDGLEIMNPGESKPCLSANMTIINDAIQHLATHGTAIFNYDGKHISYHSAFKLSGDKKDI